MIAAWWYTRSPRLRWTIRIYTVCYLVCAWMMKSQAAIARADDTTEAVSRSGNMMGWTGLHSLRGIPSASMHLITLSDRRGNGFFDVILAIVQVFKDIVTFTFPAGLLTGAVACFLLFMSLILWLFKFAQSMVWLQWLAALFAPLFTALVQVVVQLGILPACLVVGLTTGGVVFMLGERGRGMAMMAAAFGVGLLSLAFFSDPVGDLYSPDTGLLATIRHLGFQVGEAAARNGALPGATGAAQLDNAMARMVTSLQEGPLMQVNFGHVLGSQCDGAYKEALATADSSAALDKIRGCDSDAADYAEHLAWEALAAVGIFGLLAAVMGLFIIYVVVAEVEVGFKAGAYAISVVPMSGPGAIPGPTQRVWIQLIKNLGMAGLEWFAYTVFASFIAVLMISATGEEFAARTGINHPVVKFLVATILSAAAIVAFWKITGSFRTMSFRKVSKAMSGPATAAQAAMLGTFAKGQSAGEWAHNWLNSRGEGESDSADDEDSDGQGKNSPRDPDVPTLPDNIPETVVPTTASAPDSREVQGSTTSRTQAAADAAVATAAPEAAVAQRVAERVRGRGHGENEDPSAGGGGAGVTHAAQRYLTDDHQPDHDGAPRRGDVDSTPAVPGLPDVAADTANREPSNDGPGPTVQTTPEGE
ncbi:hypothetical protein [Mycolicibacterium farcinogenes]|uniref:Uncharacterized protein n=1 Tax=Mycolicibacterium farcinogenes TaxID=1802 RepID=A0ACD1FR40_MYCFR|nr:hypothetical protein [Mycolicibacterium farcinogenes]QZH69530.1 hypothetical protein K6L26_31400 [Mycolicibacterium farcinogenes]